jgi:hypothetical protein
MTIPRKPFPTAQTLSHFKRSARCCKKSKSSRP